MINGLQEKCIERMLQLQKRMPRPVIMKEVNEELRGSTNAQVDAIMLIPELTAKQNMLKMSEYLKWQQLTPQLGHPQLCKP